MFERNIENLLLTGYKYIKQKEHLVNKFSGDIGKTEILIDIKKNFMGQRNMKEIVMLIPGDLCGKLMHLSNQSDLTLFIILAAGLKSLIYRYTNSEDIAVISPVYERMVSEETINNFIFIRDAVSGSMSFKDLLVQVKQSVVEAYENQDYPAEKLLEYLFETTSGPKADLITDIGCSLRSIHDEIDINHLGLSLFFSFSREGDRLSGSIVFDLNTYEKCYIERLSGHFLSLLERVMGDIEIKIPDISFLSKEEKKELLYDFNSSTADLPGDQTIFHLFEKQAKRTPDRIAVTFNGENLAYRRLNEEAAQLAVLLRGKGIKKDQLAGILLIRTPAMIVSMLAVWNAGGAYIPLDVNYPVKRIIGILNDSRAAVLLTHSRHINSIFREEYQGSIINVDSEEYEETGYRGVSNSDLALCVNDLAYVIYTSGSTGHPKGVMVEHTGMVNHIQAKINDLQISENSIVVQNASHTFDISVWQFFTALTLGGRTIIYTEELVLDLDRFLAQLIKDRVTILEVVPSYLSVMLDMLALKFLNFRFLKYLLVTGEVLRPNLVNSWFEKYPGIKIVNAYGPTEASDDITHYVMDKAVDVEQIPIGRPLQNINIYIVDNNMNLCPIGVKGEICVSGICVGRGYLYDDERTMRVFLKDPFKKDKELRLYKTGDLGYWLPGGTIEFLGRKDYQVKIRGFRIELGEIEAVLSKHASIKEVVVIDKEDEQGNNYLCAYIVPVGIFNVGGIKNHLTENLPDYMIPAHFVELKKIPLTSNGKIDRKALADIAPDNSPGLPYISVEMLKLAGETVEKSFVEKNAIEEKPQTEHLLSREEKERILYFFNDTNAEFPKDKSIHKLFEVQAEKTPGAVSVVVKEERITFREINRRSNHLARLLRAKGVTPNTPVAVMLENSITMITGILGILKAAGAILPIDIEYPLKRKQLMLDDSGTRLLISRKTYIDNAADQVEFIDMEKAVPGENDAGNLEHLNQPADWAFIMYTSGSTGKPKGSGIHHGGFTNLIDWFVKAFTIKPDDAFLLTTSIGFDLTLKNIFAPLVTGGTLTLTASNYFDPSLVLREISRNQITCINLTPSMCRPLMEYKDEIEKLVSLRYLFQGGEAMVVAPLKQWIESVYFNAELVNAYGPSECTSVCSLFSIENPRDFYERPVPIGKPINNMRLYILDTHFLPVPVGVQGELFVAGEGVSNGYLNNSPLTSEKFVTVSGIGPDIRLYRTGDLVRWLPDGNIEFLGRVDHQVKVRGLRIELGEIETLLLSHDDIKEAVVIARENEEGNKYLCACVVSENDLLETEIREYLSQELPLYMLPEYFVRLEAMPLTPNGKIDRKLLTVPDIWIKKGFEIEPPANETEKKLVEIWHEVLGITRDKIGVKANFFDLGGHSLKATIMAARIHKEMNVKLPLVEVFKSPTIRGLSESIKALKMEKFVSIEPVEKKEYYVLSSAQKRLYILRQTDKADTVYNISMFLRMEGDIDRDRVEAAFQKLIKRHEILRTSFITLKGEPVQKIHRDVEFKIEYFETEEEKAKEIVDNFVRPFDLSRPPLLRAGLINTGDGSCIWMIDMYHIVSDGVSAGLFTQDFLALYHGEELPPLKLQYKDFCEWQNRRSQVGMKDKQKLFWLETFKDGDIPVLNLQPDYPRPPVRNIEEGDFIIFELGKELCEKLAEVVKKTGATSFQVLLAAYNILLAKYTKQDDIVVGTLLTGRSHADLENVIGFFVNILPIRNRPEKHKTFIEFLTEVKERTLDVYDNQDYSFDELVVDLGLQGASGRNPLFDTVFTMNPADKAAKTGTGNPGFKFQPYGDGSKFAKFELYFDATESNETINILLRYSTQLFKPSTIQNIAKYYTEIVTQVVENLTIKLKDIALSHELLTSSSTIHTSVEGDFNL